MNSGVEIFPAKMISYEEISDAIFVITLKEMLTQDDINKYRSKAIVYRIAQDRGESLVDNYGKVNEIFNREYPNGKMSDH